MRTIVRYHRWLRVLLLTERTDKEEELHVTYIFFEKYKKFFLHFPENMIL